MYLVAGFEGNAYLEMALHELEQCDIDHTGIVTIEMEAQQSPQTLFDSIHYSDGESMLDGMAAWAVMFSVCGIVYGSQVKFGPILLGLIGFAVGALFGLFLDTIRRARRPRTKAGRNIEVCVLIPCTTKEQMKLASSVCRKYKVLSLGQHTV